MSGRDGQTWRFGDDESGYIVLVVETVNPVHHRCCVLEAIGGWRTILAPGDVRDQYELRPWEDDAWWRRLG